MSKREQVLNALFARLSALPDVKVERNAVLPVKIPDNGLVVLRDGDIGEPEILLSPACYVFHHKAEIEVLIQQVEDSDNDTKLDRILEAIGLILKVDVTLSGLIDYMHADPPEFIEQPVEGGLTIKGAIVPIVLEYVSDSNLT
ncbi:MAG: acyl-CoA transferase [Alphaproteobacteria bacterium]|nr:acyl-CoA transferase [Alphaproteobacteria bacterium]